jgi:hypothetical protein
MDLVVANMNEPAGVLRNSACGKNGFHWAGFSLARPDRSDVTGARLELVSGGKSRYRFAKGGGSYASSPDRRMVVGLGSNNAIEGVKVRWPDGKEEVFGGVAVDRYQKLVMGTGKAQ